jgi:hypothetical protein
MTIQIDKALALETYAYARQAERSVDFAIGSVSQWESLRQYYTGPRRDGLVKLVGRLRGLVRSNSVIPTRDRFYKQRWTTLIALPFMAIINQTKSAWRFSEGELVFFAEHLGNLLEILPSGEPPPRAGLIDLRMNLFMCQWIIERHLFGVSELKKANNIEHFCQPMHLRHFLMNEIM